MITYSLNEDNNFIDNFSMITTYYRKITPSSKMKSVHPFQSQAFHKNPSPKLHMLALLQVFLL